MSFIVKHRIEYKTNKMNEKTNEQQQKILANATEKLQFHFIFHAKSQMNREETFVLYKLLSEMFHVQILFAYSNLLNNCPQEPRTEIR